MNLLRLINSFFTKKRFDFKSLQIEIERKGKEMKKFFENLGNWALFLVLACGAVVVTHMTGVHLGYLKQASDIMQLSSIDLAIELIGFLTTVILTGFALKSAWRSVGASGNGFVFGVIYASLISLIMTLRIDLLIKANIEYSIILFGVLLIVFLVMGFRFIPLRTQALMIFFEKVIKEELSEGMAWVIPMSNTRYFTTTTQTLSLKMNEDDKEIPSFPNGTKAGAINLVFLYHMKKGYLHKIINLGANWMQEIQIVMRDSLRSSILTVCYLVTPEELKKLYMSSYSVYINNSIKMVKVIMSYGIMFPSVKEFPTLLEDGFWQARAIATYDRLWFESNGYTKKIVVSPDGIRESVTVDATGEQPTQLLKDELGLISDEEKIQDIVDKDVKIFTISHLQRDAVIRNGKSLSNMPQNGIFQKVRKMAFEPESLNITSIDVRKDIEDSYAQIEKEEAERKAEKRHADTHTALVDALIKRGIKPHVATYMAGKMQGMDLHDFDIKHFSGDTDLGALGALISQALRKE